MISAVILAKNEEGQIRNCIKSVKFCNEIIVIDDYSSDKTNQIAKDLGAYVIKRKLNKDFSEQRNYGLKIANNEWVLFVDADEIITKALANEILRKINKSEYCGFWVDRLQHWRGIELSHGEWSSSSFLNQWGNNKLLRLGKKNVGVWKRAIHEYWHIEGKIGKLTNNLIHEKTDNISEILNNTVFQAMIHAKSNLDENKISSRVKIIFMPVAKFIYNYVVKKGFMDGIAGFIMAIIMSFHSFLAWSEIWLMQNNYKKV